MTVQCATTGHAGGGGAGGRGGGGDGGGLRRATENVAPGCDDARRTRSLHAPLQQHSLWRRQHSHAPLTMAAAAAAPRPAAKAGLEATVG